MSNDPERRPRVRLLPRRHKRARAGHPWVYSNEIAMDNSAKALKPGTLVTLLPHEGEALGVASFNARTLIAARVLAASPTTAIDGGWIASRLEAAVRLRERFYDRPFYRLIHSEADGLPGLVVDRFGDAVACQLNTAGMDRLENEVLAALDTVLGPELVVLRNNSPARELEGLSREVRVAKGTLDGPVTLEENGVTFFADLEGGQKTGWFYDQRENRAFLAGLAEGCRVLDVYAYAGGFAIAAAAAGAREAVAVDRSEAALELAARAAQANGVDGRCRFEKADAFTYMAALAESGESFDIVAADPPAFVRSKKDLPGGLRAYRKMARLATALVKPKGLLLVASCSHNVSPDAFAEQVRRAVSDLGRGGRILRQAGAGPDHPVHPQLPESAYLKTLVLELD